MNYKKILIIESNPESAKDLQAQMETCKFSVEVCLTAKEGIALSQKGDYDLILLDLDLPDAYALEISNHLYQPFAVMTKSTSKNTKAMAEEQGAMAYIPKPFKVLDILPILQGAIENGAKLYEEKMADVLKKGVFDAPGAADRNKDSIFIAMGCLIAELGISQRDAFLRIRNASESAKVSMELIGTKIVSEFENREK